MTDSKAPLLIKRYASRRLYNTETSDYVTLDDIARFIREGREVQIVDLKSGDDLTRQYLLQIIAEHESKGENILPISVLTDLVRGYANQASSIVPEFLASSFEVIQESQNKMLENMTRANPLAAFPGLELIQEQQRAFFSAMMNGAHGANAADKTGESGAPASDESEIADIKRQLSELQEKLGKM